MNKHKHKHKHTRLHAVRRVAAFGLLGVLTVPVTGTASPLDEITPAPMSDNPPCESSTVRLEVDVSTGLIYLVDPATGNLTLTDNDLTVSFGDLGHVVVMLHYTSSDWNVVVTPDADPPRTYATTNGWLRYSITDDVEEYVFSSTEVASGASASAMATMTPVVPDIVIRPKKICPPPV